MLAGLIATCLLAADPELSVTPLGAARPGGLLRVAVSSTAIPATAVGPLRIDVALLDGARSLAATGIALTRPADLAEASILVLGCPASANGRLRVRATATWPGPPGLPPRALVAEADVDSPAARLADAIASVAALRAAGAGDPLPWLWAEGIAELAAGGADAASMGDMSACAGRLRAWLDGERSAGLRPGGNELALRDPVDGSVQPWRLHLPPGQGPFPCALLLPPVQGSSKLRWPAWDARQVQAALDAGFAAVECHPAGDRTWSGAARRRIAIAIAEAVRLGAVDAGRGVALVAGPADGLPYPRHAPGPQATDPSWWRAAASPAAPAAPPATGWADAPFAVVVGTGEHAAAVAANRTLAAAFLAAYAAHALAVVEALDDTCDPARLAGRNLVLIGNPRSNRVLAGLGLRLPFAWDHRIVTGPAGFSAMRASLPSLACQARTEDGRAVLVIDGAPPPWGAGLPLAGAALPLALPGGSQGGPAAR